MKKAHAGISTPALLLTWLREALPIILKKDIPPGEIRRVPAKTAQGYGEIAMVCQFVGDIEGEMTLLTSRKTAAAMVDVISPRPASGTVEEVQILKKCLGELLNVLMSKMLARCKEYYDVLRVTTPSCIFGADLEIEPSQEGTMATSFETPFGGLDVVITFHSPEE